MCRKDNDNDNMRIYSRNILLSFGRTKRTPRILVVEVDKNLRHVEAH